MYDEWLEALKEKRRCYGVSQNLLAVEAGISRRYLVDVENGKRVPSEDLKKSLTEALERLDPNKPLEMVIDYMRIRFPTMDMRYVVEDILFLKMEHMIHEDYAFYSYSEHYHFGDIVLMISPDEEKGILLELKGKGCRQFENFLLAQHRSWYDFLQLVMMEDGVFKRVDLAINDRAGYLDIPELKRKCDNGECVSKFRSYRSYSSGELVHWEEKPDMGNTLYVGSMKSEVYFCIYEKDYEQYIKNGIPVEDADIKNRFEIRLRDERAFYAMKDLVTYMDAADTTMSIINRYLRFVDKDDTRESRYWELNHRWSRFIGDHERQLKLTTKPEPYTLERTLKWLSHQVAPTLKMQRIIDSKMETNVLENMIENASLRERHEKIIKQQLLPVDEVVYKKERKKEK